MKVNHGLLKVSIGLWIGALSSSAMLSGCVEGEAWLPSGGFDSEPNTSCDSISNGLVFEGTRLTSIEAPRNEKNTLLNLVSIENLSQTREVSPSSRMLYRLEGPKGQVTLTIVAKSMQDGNIQVLDAEARMENSETRETLSRKTGEFMLYPCVQV